MTKQNESLLDKTMAAAGLLLNPLMLLGFMVVFLLLAIEWVVVHATGSIEKPKKSA